MAIILYINNEHCLSLEQLKGYFSENLTPESNIYADLLDYGRHGEIAEWLREMGEAELATSIDSIDTGLSDSAFYAQLRAAITGIVHDPEPLSFNKCFSFEGVKCEVKDNEAKVTVSLKVLMCVNENYELSVSSNWGTRAKLISPYSHPEGKTASFVFTLRKRPGKNIGDITVKADGRVLADEIVPSKSIDNNSEIRVGNVKFKMIHVEGGTFTMGGREQDSDANVYEKPAHQVTLSSYSIGETPVTQELWKAVMGNYPSYFKGTQQPVESVSRNDCQEFIWKLNQMTGKNFRLPTEAEWEYAARGGMKSKGYKYSGSNVIDEVAWYSENSSHITHPVKEKKPNELGIYDMSGNVGEWCQDWWGSYTSSSQTNPIGPTSGSGCVYRGGGWGNSASYCRLSYRSSFTPYNAKYDLGFRLVLSELKTSG